MKSIEMAVRLFLFVGFSVAALPLVASCDDGPAADQSGASAQAAQQRADDCLAWCEIEEGMRCRSASLPRTDCALFCSKEGACGDAGPALACHREDPTLFQCARSSVMGRGVCESPVSDFHEAVIACMKDVAATPPPRPEEGAAGSGR